jgi:hypothetical protein
MTREEFIATLDKMMKDAKNWEVSISREPEEDHFTIPDFPGMRKFKPSPTIDVHVRITAKPPKAKKRRPVASAKKPR